MKELWHAFPFPLRLAAAFAAAWIVPGIVMLVFG